MIARLLISLLLLFPVLANAQTGPWRYISGGGGTKAAPTLLDTGRYDVELAPTLEIESTGAELLQFFDTTTNRFEADFLDVYRPRFGFSYRLPAGEDFVEFDVFLDIGTGFDPLRVGHYEESTVGKWRDVNPEFQFFAGDSIAARGGILYFRVWQGSLEVADFDLMTEWVHDDDNVVGPAIVYSASISDGTTNLVGTKTVPIETPTTTQTVEDVTAVSLAGNTVTFLEAGYYDLQVYTAVQGNLARLTPSFYLLKNGTEDIGGHSIYIRNANGQNRGRRTTRILHQFEVGDTIVLMGGREDTLTGTASTITYGGGLRFEIFKS